jgi:hypothetical protein
MRFETEQGTLSRAIGLLRKERPTPQAVSARVEADSEPPAGGQAVRIGIDARLLTGAYTGDRTYWRGLLKAFNELLSPNEHRLVLFSTRPIPSGTAARIAAL